MHISEKINKRTMFLHRFLFPVSGSVPASDGLDVLNGKYLVNFVLWNFPDAICYKAVHNEWTNETILNAIIRIFHF